MSPSQRAFPWPTTWKNPLPTSKSFYYVLCYLLFSITMEIKNNLDTYFLDNWILVFQCCQAPLEHKPQKNRDLSISFASVLPRPCRVFRVSTQQITNEWMEWTNIYWVKITESSWNLIIFCFQYINFCFFIWVKWYWFSLRAGRDKLFLQKVSW